MGKVVKKIGKVIGGVFKAGFGLVGMLFRKPKVEKATTNEATESRLTLSLRPEENKKILFGETAMGTDLRYWESYGGGSNRHVQVIAGAGHEIESFGNTYFDEVPAPFVGGIASGQYAGVVGRTTVTKGVSGGGFAIGAGAKWTASAAMTGCAYFVLDWVYTQEKLPNGIPQRVTQVGKGAKVYDPRRDSTRGGSGTHRADNPATWAYATLDSNGQPIGRNNALQMLAYTLGIKVQKPATGEWVLIGGRGATPSDVNFESFITAANDCELEGWYSDCLLSTGDDHSTNEGILEAASGGDLQDTGGRFSYYVSTNDTANIAASFDTSDIVGQVEWNQQKPMSAQFNEIPGTFTDPAALFQQRPLPMAWDQAYYDIDGYKKRAETRELVAVQSSTQGQKLLRRYLNRSRYQGEFSAVFNLKALKVRNHDIVTVTYAPFAWVNKLFRVTQQGIAAVGGITLILEEEHASIYSAGTVVVQPAPSAGFGGNPYEEVSVTGVVTLATGIATGNNAVDAIQVTWDLPAENVKRTEVQYKKSTETYWQTYAPLRRDQNFAILAPLIASTAHNIRVRHISLWDVPGPWLAVNRTTNAVTRNAAGLVVYADGTLVQNLQPAEAGSDVTLSHVAAAILGQGSGALANNLQDLNPTDYNNLQTALNDSATALTRAATALSAADGIINTYFQAAAPSTVTSGVGDVWVKNNVTPNTYWQLGINAVSGVKTWVDATGNPIVLAIVAASTAQGTADGKMAVFYQTTQPASPPAAIGDLWVDTDDGAKPIRRFAGGGSWPIIADVTGFNIAAAIEGQGPGATDPREPDIVVSQNPFAPRKTIGGFAASNLAQMSFVNMTGANTPEGGNGTRRFTRTGSLSNYLSVNGLGGIQGVFMDVIRCRIRCPDDAPIAEQWRGLVQVEGVFSDGSTTKSKTIAFPIQKNFGQADRTRIPTDRYVWAEWDFEGDPIYATGLVTQVRFYLIPASLGAGRMDVDWIAIGSRNSDPLGLQNVTYGADPTGANVSAAVVGQTDWATYVAPITRVSNLSDTGFLNSLGNITTRNLSQLNGRTGAFINYTTGGLTLDDLRPAAAGADPTGSNVAAAVTGQGDLALQNFIVASQGPKWTVSENLMIDGYLQDPNGSWTFRNGANRTTTDAQLVSVLVPAAITFNYASYNGSIMEAEALVLPVTPGAPYRFAMRGRLVTGLTGYVYAYIQHYDKDMVSLGTGGTNRVGVTFNDYRNSALATSSTGVREVDYVTPATAAFAIITFYCAWSPTLVNAGRALVGNFSLKTRVIDARMGSRGLLSAALVGRNPANPITVSNSGGARINIAAFTVSGDWGSTVFNAGLITGLAYSTGYHVWIVDSFFTGGAVTYVASTTRAAFANNNSYYYLGACVTLASGGGAGAPPVDPNPPTWDCVHVEAVLSTGKLAGESQVGDDLLKLSDDGETSFVGKVTAIRHATTECLLLETESGAQLVCSSKTPLTAKDGSVIKADEAQVGRMVGVWQKGMAEHEVRWEALVKITEVGKQPVAMISADGGTYAAGLSNDHMIFTHNIQMSKQ